MYSGKPSSETQGQIVEARESRNRRKNMAQKKSKERPEEPLGTMSYQTSSKRSPPLWLLIGARKTQVSWHQSEARTLDFPSPPLSAPGSLRMVKITNLSPIIQVSVEFCNFVESYMLLHYYHFQTWQLKMPRQWFFFFFHFILNMFIDNHIK